MFFKRLVIIISCVLLFVLGAFSTVGCAEDKFTVRFESGAIDAELYYGKGKEVQKVSSSSQIVEPVYIRPGYNFVGWNKSISMLNKDSTVVAQWKAYDFEVVFYGNGGVDGQGNKMITVQTDSAYNLVLNQPEFIKTGYELTWDVDLNYITRSCSVNAIWTPKKYDLVFKDIFGNDFNGNILKINYKESVGDILVSPPAVQNKRLAFWENDNGLPLDKGVVWNFDNGETLYPNYVADNEFLIKYDLNGGQRGQKVYSFDAGQSENAKILTDPVRIGYGFKGWLINDSTEPKSSDEITLKDFKVNGVYQDVRLTAVWESRPYRITFDTDGGNILGDDEKEISFGNALGELPTAEKQGYEFFGWEYDGEVIKENSVWDIPFDATFKAVYKAKYTVRFSLMSIIGKDNNELECRLVKWGGVKNDGMTEFEDVLFELVEGQSLYSRYGFEVMPIVDPIEPKGINEYVFGNRWLYFDAQGNSYQINHGTIFSTQNLNGIKGGDTIVLIPYCKLIWSPRY